MAGRLSLLAAAFTTTAFAQSGYGNFGSWGSYGQNGGTADPASAEQEFSKEMKFRLRVLLAHGVCMSLAFAFMMPFGSAVIRLLSVRGTVWIHGVWQIVAYLLALAGFGMGIWIAHGRGLLAHPHPIIGIIVIGVLFLQPLSGLIAHSRFKKVGRNSAGLGHRWTGRIFVTLGAINGGLGIQLARSPRRWIIGYSVVAAIFFLLWWTSSLIDWYRNRRHSSHVPRVKGHNDIDF